MERRICPDCPHKPHYVGSFEVATQIMALRGLAARIEAIHRHNSDLERVSRERKHK